MRPLSQLSLVITSVAFAACGGQDSKPTEQKSALASAEPKVRRDLTLQVRTAPPVEVASAIELALPRPEPRPAPRPKISRKPAPAPTPDPEPEAAPAAEAAAPVPSGAVTPVMAEPVPVEDASAGSGRELAPGKTVTIVPVSSGPSLTADEDDSWLPDRRARGIVTGGGGTCRPRGGVRGIGIAGRIPVGKPARRLR